MREVGLNIREGCWLNRANYRPLLDAAISAKLTWDNYETELQRAADDNSVARTAPDYSAYNDFIDWIFFNASAFNHADNDSLDNALTNRTMTIADLDTYAAAYTP